MGSATSLPTPSSSNTGSTNSSRSFSSSSSSSSSSTTTTSPMSTSSHAPRNFLTPDTIFSNQHTSFITPTTMNSQGGAILMPSLPLLLSPGLNFTGLLPGGLGGSASSYYPLGGGVPMVPAKMENAGAVKNNFNVHKDTIHFYLYRNTYTDPPVINFNNSNDDHSSSSLFVSSSSSSLFLSFQYDATEPCIITPYFMTVEQPPQSPLPNVPFPSSSVPSPPAFRSLSDRLITKFKHSGIHYLVPPGLKQIFDQRTAIRIVFDTSTVSTANSYSILPPTSTHTNSTVSKSENNNDDSLTTLPSSSSSSSFAENELFDVRLYTAEEILHIPPFIIAAAGNNSSLQRTHTGESLNHNKQLLHNTFPSLGSYILPPPTDDISTTNSNSIPIPPTMFPIVIVMEGIPAASAITASLLQFLQFSLSSSSSSSLPNDNDSTGNIHTTTTTTPARCTTAAQMQVTYGTITLPSIVNNNTSRRSSLPSSLEVRVLQQKIQVGSSIYIIRELFGSDGNLRHSSSSSSNGNNNSNTPTKSNQKETMDTILRSNNLSEGNTVSDSSVFATNGGTANRSASSSSTDKTGGSDSSSFSELGISGTECVICLTEPRNTAILPCRHTCLCNACAQQLRVQTNKCPICRTPVKSLLVIDMKG